MRTLLRNKQNFKYANILTKSPKVLTDKEGNILKSGNSETYYSEPIDFKASIAESGNESHMAEYGLNVGDYHAKLIVPHKSIPIKEGSLIWYNSEPEYDEFGGGTKKSADYVVVKITPQLNVDRLILQRLNH